MLRLQNFYEHPSQKKFMVFEYYQEEMAIYFEQLLLAADIEYEKGEEERKNQMCYLFGVEKKHKDTSLALNTKVLVKYKPPFIPIPGLKWFTILFTLALITLAFIGYFKSTL